MIRQYKGILLVILSAVLFGCMPLIAKIVYQNGGTPAGLTFLRNFLALPVLWVMMKRGGGEIMLKREKIVAMFWLSLGFAGTPMLLFSSYSSISTGMATTLHFIYPVFVLLGCVLFFHEKLSRIKLLCVALCTGGILLFYTPGDSASLSGMALAFCSGITFAFYVIYLAKSGLSTMPPFALGFWISLFSSIELAVYLAVTGSLQISMTPLGWGVSLLFSMLIAIVASVSFQIGVKEIGAQRAAILSTFEPITSIVIGIFVFSEAFGLKTALGVLLILAAVLVLTVFDHEKTAA